VLGQNPGPFTLQGTNTYLIGTKPPYILLDTGEGKPGYTELLSQAVPQLEVSDIVLSHWHKDHVAGLPSVLALLETRPRIWKFNERDHPLGIEDLKELHDGQILEAQDGITKLKVILTPGHTADSVALLLEGEALFTADTVLGQGTSIFEDLTSYMFSLNRLEHILKAEKGAGRSETLYPAHGPVVKNGLEWVRGYIEHRQLREEQVVEALEKAKEPLTVMECVQPLRRDVADVFERVESPSWCMLG
jgi:ribonuclease/clavin/mitogillin